MTNQKDTMPDEIYAWRGVSSGNLHCYHTRQSPDETRYHHESVIQAKDAQIEKLVDALREVSLSYSTPATTDTFTARLQAIAKHALAQHEDDGGITKLKAERDLQARGLVGYRGVDGGGSDEDDGSMDWKQSVETRLGQLHSDIRLGACGLAAIMLAIIGLYMWTGSKIDEVTKNFPPLSEKISSISERASVIEVRGQNIENTVVSIDRKLDLLDDKMNQLLIGKKKDESQGSTEEKQADPVYQGAGE